MCFLSLLAHAYKERYGYGILQNGDRKTHLETNDSCVYILFSDRKVTTFKIFRIHRTHVKLIQSHR